LTIIAYRGPITKSEIEQIRGVNCSVILKNLMIKGLIESEPNKEKMSDEYNITVDFLKYLGINNAKELPNYEKLNTSETINTILNQNQNE
jgi:segregation and condensation protein B